MPTTDRPASAMTTVSAGDHDGASRRCRRRVPIAVGGVHAAAQLLPVTGDDEQRVVDADRQAEHGGEGQGRRRDRR